MQLRKASIALLSALALTACNDDETVKLNTQEVRFSSFVYGASTKVAGSTWEVNDQVGVYMVKHDAQLSATTILNGAENKKYVTSAGDGNFQGFNSNEIIYFPEGTTVDFVSYYPYKEGLSNYTYTVDLTDQSQQGKIDLLYSNNAKGVDASSNTTLVYKHRLSRMMFTIQSIDGNEELAGLAVSISGLKTRASLFLPDGTLTLADDSKESIETKVSHMAGGGAVAEAILLPEQDVKDVVITFDLPGAGTFEHKIASLSLNSGAQQNYTVKLNHTEGNNSVVVLNSSITPWTEQNGGNIDVDFDEEGGGSVDPTPDPDPNPDPDPTPSGEPTFFTETFGETVAKGADGYWPGVNAYTGWDNQNLTFSDPGMTGTYSNASVRQTSTLNPHVWFAANKDSQLQIGGLVTTGCTNLKLTYKITANANGDQSNIKVFAGDTELTVPAKAIATTNTYQTVELTGLTPGFTTITFKSESTVNTAGFRIDDVSLTGDKL